MSRSDLSQRLLAHLLDPESDHGLELAALEDDTFFSELQAAEAELVERYISGELDEAQSLGLAELIGRSPRLQESAETTLALRTREAVETTLAPRIRRAQAPGSGSSSAHLPPRGPAYLAQWTILILCTFLALALWNLKANVNEHRATIEAMAERQRALDADVEALEQRLQDLTRDQLRLERQWAEQQSEDAQTTRE